MLLQTTSLGLKRKALPSGKPSTHQSSLAFQGNSKGLQEILESHKDIQNRRTVQAENPNGSKNGLGKKLAYTLWAITGFTTALIGSNWVYKYHTDKPQGEQAVALESKMAEYEKNTGSEWRNFNTWVDSAKQNKTSYNFPLNTQLEFQSRLNTVLKSFVTTLENSDNPDDKALAEKLKFNSLENDTRIDKVGLNLIAHLNQQKAKGASLNVQGYIEKSPDFQHLSSREKEALSAEIFTLYNANPNINLDRFKKGSVDTEKTNAEREKKALSTEARLRDLVGISLGSPFQGVSLDQFAAIQTKADAQQFFETVVKNPNNFSQLSPEERAQFVNRGKDILEVLDYSFISHSRSYGIAAYLLLLIGGTSAGALSLHTVSKLKKHLQNRKNYLSDPVVVVEKLTDVEHGKLSQLNSMIQAHCKSIYTARNKAMARYPEVKAFMAGLYGPRSVDLPNTNALTNFYKNSAQVHWVETKKSNTLSSLNLAEEMKKLIDLAEKRSYYFPEFLSDSVIGKGVLSKETTSFASSDPKDVKASLEFELEHIKTRLAEVQLAKINHLIGMSLLQDSLEESDSKKTGEKTSSRPDETPRDTKMKEASLTSLKSNLTLQEMVLEEFQGLQNVLEEQALSCELLLLDEKDAQQFKEKWGALEKLQKVNETVQVNPQLSALREKVLQQKYTHQSIFDSLDAQRKARAILEGKLETTLKKGPST